MEWIVFKSNQKKPESETAYNNLCKKNKQILDKWLMEKAITSKGEHRAGNRKRAIIKLLTFVKKDYDKIIYDDYVNVASAISKADMEVNSKNEDRYFIGRFLKDNFEDADKKFKGLRLFKLEQQKDNEKIRPDELLTGDEINQLINATLKKRNIALITTLTVSAARPEEILKLRWCDIDFKHKSINLYSAKTGKMRDVPIDTAINHLEKLKEEIKPKEDDLVFPSTKGKIMTNAGLNYLLQELVKKTKIKKRVWPYLFRHTRLNSLMNKISVPIYEKIAGHSIEQGMKTYSHLTKDEVIREMDEKVFAKKKLSVEEQNKLEQEIQQIKEGNKNRDKFLKQFLKQYFPAELHDKLDKADFDKINLDKLGEALQVPI